MIWLQSIIILINKLKTVLKPTGKKERKITILCQDVNLWLLVVSYFPCPLSPPAPLCLLRMKEESLEEKGTSKRQSILLKKPNAPVCHFPVITCSF